ncbi:MAG TPA: class I SAM-dependent methyltransferase [Solirubrobacterales bacterium]|nr:class I SAM-dependent methyltransferase [Solirubrobacterales bacterium]
MTKEQAEMFYWQDRYQTEGTLGNAHYEQFYTEQFGLSRSDYENKRVLDIGCGPRGSLEWAEGALERVGLDPLVGQYRKLGIDSHGMKYVEAGAEQIPFPDEHFDVVAAFNALDHVDDADAAVHEISRITKSGGIGLVIVEVNHRPRPTEPQTLEWEFLERFSGWRIVSESRVAINREHDVYASWLEAKAWRRGAGLLGARLERL